MGSSYESYARRTTVQPGAYTYSIEAVAGPRCARQIGTITVTAPRTLMDLIVVIREELRPSFGRGERIFVTDFGIDPARPTEA
ncbi:hypothetical protein ACFWXO_36750 [Kitasatospora sp. NPDC059088]|uniref:hypothetical protein n=1 Tax=Kitasatospora sp. NPDC059088 TaxID=3346722 RepID=UPI003675BC95